jgi:hypothetical protein
MKETKKEIMTKVKYRKKQEVKTNKRQRKTEQKQGQVSIYD